MQSDRQHVSVMLISYLSHQVVQKDIKEAQVMLSLNWIMGCSKMSLFFFNVVVNKVIENRDLGLIIMVMIYFYHITHP